MLLSHCATTFHRGVAESSWLCTQLLAHLLQQAPDQHCMTSDEALMEVVDLSSNGEIGDGICRALVIVAEGPAVCFCLGIFRASLPFSRVLLFAGGAPPQLQPIKNIACRIVLLAHKHQQWEWCASGFAWQEYQRISDLCQRLEIDAEFQRCIMRCTQLDALAVKPEGFLCAVLVKQRMLLYQDLEVQTGNRQCAELEDLSAADWVHIDSLSVPELHQLRQAPLCTWAQILQDMDEDSDVESIWTDGDLYSTVSE